jgi:glycosyltransferase involved in cell wall biosynthesis
MNKKTYHIKNIFDPNGYYYTRALEKHISAADVVTVVSSYLYDKYNADHIIRHARNKHKFNPKETEPADIGIGENKTVIMYMGTPSQHKGLELGFKSIQRSSHSDNIKFVFPSEPDNQFTKELINKYSNLDVSPIKPFSFSYLPNYLKNADIILVPQSRSIVSQGQVPVKLIDAMAMAKPIISTDVGDIPDILDGCGLIIEPSSIDGMANYIDLLVESPETAKEYGQAAREKFVNNLSFDSIQDDLKRVIASINET